MAVEDRDEGRGPGEDRDPGEGREAGGPGEAGVRPGWPTGWPGVDRAVERLLKGAGEALGGGLAGVYLGGSLALGGFHPPASDLDVLAATTGPLPEAVLGRLRRLHRGLAAEGGWAARLEVVYLPLAPLRRYHPADAGPYPVGGDGRGLRLVRQGPTWVLDRWVVRERGLVVAGPDPRDLIDPIGPEELRAAARASLAGQWWPGGEDVAWLRPRDRQAFAVLTACRALHCLERGTLASKPAAAAWARRRLDPPWPALVDRALAWRADGRPDDGALPETLRFLAEARELAGTPDRRR